MDMLVRNRSELCNGAKAFKGSSNERFFYFSLRKNTVTLPVHGVRPHTARSRRQQLSLDVPAFTYWPLRGPTPKDKYTSPLPHKLQRINKLAGEPILVFVYDYNYEPLFNLGMGLTAGRGPLLILNLAADESMSLPLPYTGRVGGALNG